MSVTPPMHDVPPPTDQSPDHPSAQASAGPPAEEVLPALGVRHPAVGPIRAWDRFRAWLAPAGIAWAFLVVIAFLFIDESVIRWVDGWPRPARSVASWLTDLADGGPLFEGMVAALLVVGVMRVRADPGHPLRPWLGFTCVTVVAGLVGLAIVTAGAEQTPLDRLTVMLSGLANRVLDWSRGRAPLRIVVFCITLWAVTRRPTGLAWTGLFLTGLGLAGIAVNILKVIIGRYRPNRLINDDLWGFAPLSVGYSVNSFPSGHSTVAGACGALLCVLWPRLWPLWVVLALVTGMTRIGTRSHFPADVIAGLGLGAAVGLATYVLFRRLGLLQIDPPALTRR